MVRKTVTLATDMWQNFMMDSMYRNSMYLIANSLMLAGTGFIFWSIAARIYDAHSVGLISTIVTISTFIATASFMGIDHALIRYMTRKSNDKSVMINSSLTIAGISTIISTIIFILIIPIVAPDLIFILNESMWTLLLLGAMVLTAWNILTNSIFVALRVTKYVLLASLFFGILRIPLIFIMAPLDTKGLFLAHTLALLMAVVMSFVFIAKDVKLRFVPNISKKFIKQITKYSINTHISSLLEAAVPVILPLVIMHLMSPDQVAYYFMPSMIIGLLIVVPVAASQSLFAESVTDPLLIKSHLSKSLKTVITVLIPAIVILILMGWIILHIFGSNYANYGYPVLVILSLSTLPKAARYIFGAILRSKDEITTMIWGMGILLIGVSLGSYIGVSLTQSITTVAIIILAFETLIGIIYYIKAQPFIVSQR